MIKINKNKLLILFSTFILSFISCKMEIPTVNNASVFSDKASLSGVVLDLDKLSNIIGAEIKLDNNYNVKSDNKGFYLLKGINSGDHNLTVSKESYETISIVININGNMKKDFLLKPLIKSSPLNSPSPQP